MDPALLWIAVAVLVALGVAGTGLPGLPGLPLVLSGLAYESAWVVLAPTADYR